MKKSILSLLIVITLIAIVTGCSSEEEITVYSGFVEGDVIKLSSETGGLVQEVYVQEGTEIVEDKVLIVLDKSVIEAQLEQAKQGLAAAEAALEGLQAKPLQAEVDAALADIDLAEAQKAQIEQYKLMMEEQEELLLSGLQIPEAQMITPMDFALLFGTTDPDAALDMADGAIALAKTAWVQVLRGPVDAELLITEAGVEQAEALLDLLEAQLRHVDVVSPQAGRVTQILTNTGAVASPGQPLVEILDPEALTITIYVPATSITDINVGGQVSITVDSYPDEEFTGEITRIADEAQFTPSNVQTKEERVKLVFAVEVKVLDGFDKIKPGIPADVIVD